MATSSLMSVLPKASSVCRVAALRNISTSAVAMKKYRMNDPIDHATGVEKYELLAARDGNDDPFYLKPLKRGKGTKEEPNLVPAMDRFRMIGCLCNEDDAYINYMFVFQDKPTRCGCGYWFKLDYKGDPPVQYNTLPQ